MTIYVTKSSMPSFEEYTEEIRDLWESSVLTNMGSKHKKLEANLLEYLGVENITLFTNGHLALETALEAFDLKGEVITTPFTFASTTHAIVRRGLKPVFCDINPVDYTIDCSKIENLINENTCAILPVHVYGNICDIERIQEIAEKYNLKVIYDAAHAFGIEINGHGVGNFGDVSMFSFHATKVFNTIEGGALTYNDKKMGSVFNNLKNFGIAGQEIVKCPGGNAKMNEFQAAMGLCNLKHIDEEIISRKYAYELYSSILTNINGLKTNKIKPGIKNNYSYYPVLFEGFKKTRDQIFDELKEHGIFARKYFYPLVTDFDCYKSLFDDSDLPVAKCVANNILTLPLYAGMKKSDIENICKIIID